MTQAVWCFFLADLDFIQPNHQIYKGPSELKSQTPFTLESSANFLQKYHVWSLRPPLRILSLVALGSNSSSTLFFPGHQMNTQPLITAAWTWQCSQLSIYKPVCTSSACIQLSNNGMEGDSVKALGDHHSSFIHPASQPSLMVTPDCLLMLHILGNGFQEDGPLGLSREWSVSTFSSLSSISKIETVVFPTARPLLNIRVLYI